MSDVRKAVVFSFVTRYGLMIIGLASTMIIARLLTPEEIGTFAIASAITVVMTEFRLLGAGMYLVREEELTETKVRSAMGLTMLISWSMGVGIWFVAPLVANFYELAPLTPIFRILSVSFFLAPMISIPTALLMRAFKFKEILIIRLVTSLSNLVTTISLIFAGFSFYSLAWGYTVAVLVEVILVYWLRPPETRWLPSLHQLGTVMRFGIYSSLAGFFRRGVITAPDMVIGKLGTTAQVGLFSRGLGFIEFMSQTLMMGAKPVVLPYLSEVQRSGNDVNDAYTSASVMLGAVLWPVLAVASVVSLPTIRLFFGDQWDAAAPFAAILAGWAMLRGVHWFSGDLFLARGYERVMVVKEGILFALYFSGVVFSYPLGLEAVASAFVLVGFADAVITTFILARVMGLKAFVFFRAWLSNLGLAVICWLAAELIYTGGMNAGMEMSTAFLSVALCLPVVWVSSLYLIKHPVRGEVTTIFNWVLRKVSLK
ncbi:oligosaccharide flippase family protein [Marinobacter sp. MA]|uniref:oligosaccharide flippase family protein n=1 Tax=Marinobacter sp. MA TaxID=2971606 RepID=UPI003AAAFE31